MTCLPISRSHRHTLTARVLLSRDARTERLLSIARVILQGLCRYKYQARATCGSLSVADNLNIRRSHLVFDPSARLQNAAEIIPKTSSQQKGVWTRESRFVTVQRPGWERCWTTRLGPFWRHRHSPQASRSPQTGTLASVQMASPSFTMDGPVAVVTFGWKHPEPGLIIASRCSRLLVSRLPD